MRVATSQYRMHALQNIVDQQATIAGLQEQASTGRKVNRASDDPLAAAEVERLRSEQARNQIEKRMMSYAKSQMAQAEGLLGGGIETLQRARDLMINARNGAMGEQDRATIALQLEQYRVELLDIANQRTQDGNYVFAGEGSLTAPFLPQGNPTFQGQAGTRQNGITIPFNLSVNGALTLQGFGKDGKGSIFGELDKVITALRGDDAAAADKALRDGEGAVDWTLEQMSEDRSVLGEQMHMIESRERLLESGELGAAQRRSDLIDTDYAETLSGIQSRDTALRAAMQTYSQISQLSMFNYL